MGKIQISGGRALPDNAQYTNRFEIASETSNRLYVVAQNKNTGEWSCSCPAWIIKKAGKERTCKHLRAIMPELLAAENQAPKRIEAVPAPKSSGKKGRKIQVD